MKSLSVRNPYAILIMMGLKTIEVRSRNTQYRGKLLICASRTIVPTHHVYFPDDSFPLYEQVDALYLMRGNAICTVDLVRVEPFGYEHEDKAFVKHNPKNPYFAWILENANPIVPFEVSGQLGFFETDDNLIFEI